jgi:hypothetical protein
MARTGLPTTSRSISRRAMAGDFLPIPVRRVPRRLVIEEPVGVGDFCFEHAMLSPMAYSTGVAGGQFDVRKRRLLYTRANQYRSAPQTFAEIIECPLQIRESIDQRLVVTRTFRREQGHCRDACKSALRPFGEDSCTVVSRGWRSRRKSQRRSDSCSAGCGGTTAESARRRLPR